MLHQELTDLTPAYRAEITKEQLQKGLTMPVEAKSTDLIINADQIEEDAQKFELFGINWKAKQKKIIDAAAALRSAEILYTVSAKDSAVAEISWRDNRDALYSWRDESTARLSYYAKKKGDVTLVASLHKIGEGDGHLDAIQDAHETLELAEIHFDALAKNSFTAERLAEAKGLVSKVSAAYPKVLAGEKGDNSAKELRDQAYWYLCKLERELKEDELPLVFFDDYARRMEYGSNYKRSLAK